MQNYKKIEWRIIMRILFIGTVDGVSGGVAQYMQNIINNILSNEIDFFLGSLISDTNKQKYRNVTFLNFDMRYSISRIKTRIDHLHDIVQKNSINLIHAHTQRAGLLAAIYNKMYGMKVIYTPHGLRHTQLKGLKSVVHKYIDKFILNNVNIVTVLSNSEFALVKKINTKVIIKKINTRIDDNLTSYEKIQKDFKQITMIGSCDDRKQPFLFLEIAKEFRNENIKFIWVGDGILLDECKKYIQQNKLNNIDFVGQKTNDDAKEILSQSDILLFTSKQEGFPITLLEATMLKIPIVSNNFFGIDDIIIKDKTGLVFKNSNINEAKDLINKILFNEAIKTNLIENARIYFEQNHMSLELFSKEFLNLYKSVQ